MTYQYKYYFDLLPKDFKNFPVFYTKEELEYLKGSPFLSQILEKKKDMKIDYNKLCEQLRLAVRVIRRVVINANETKGS